MHLSDLMRSHVFDADGRDLGRVRDVQLVQDGPLVLPFGASFRVETLVVGGHSFGTRLGYERGGLRGPWLLRVLFRRFERGARYVDWDDVRTWDGTRVHVAKSADELSRQPPH
jgi:hypothetical protein